MKRAVMLGVLLFGVAWACAFDVSLREYLSISFWQPFSKAAGDIAVKDAVELRAAFAGMTRDDGKTALAQLRRAYQGLDDTPVETLLLSARRASGLTAMEREEVELLDVKFAMREGTKSAKEKLRRFLRTARTPEYASEARGWLGRMHFLDGEQSAAGKIYLDELLRRDSILSREVLLNSLRLTYGHDGGRKLQEQLEDYFDTAEHAVFAIELATNPVGGSRMAQPEVFAKIQTLLQKHKGLLRSEKVAALGMRAALWSGDPAAAVRLSRQAARGSSNPEFLWMLGAAKFLLKDYAGAEAPLLRLWVARKTTDSQRAAAAYGLCGVYMKMGNRVEQLRFALWLGGQTREYGTGLERVEDQTIYFASSGFDRGMLLDAEASIGDLQAFIAKYPKARGLPLVRYSLGVRLARANRYTEAAEVFDGIQARLRAGRMRKLAALYADQTVEGKFAFGVYLSENQERIYFNDRLWNMGQSYAIVGHEEARFTRQERERQIALERKLRDEQEERWRAHLLLREVVREAGPGPLGRKAAERAIVCLRRINPRFGREAEIRAGDIALIQWLRRNR